MAGQFSEDVIEALKTLSERLKNQNIHWVFAGSVSLALQGVNVTPRDKGTPPRGGLRSRWFYFVDEE